MLPPPSPLPPRLAPAPAQPVSVPRRDAALLALDGVARSYRASLGSTLLVHRALPPTTLRLRRGEWVALVGTGPAPVTLLRCAAGLVRPDQGAVRWLDDAGAPVAPPPLAMVHADWRCYACFTVRDVLESAAGAGCARATAMRRVALALRCASLGALQHGRVASLHALDRWRVGVAAAVAAGAGWLFLEIPPLRDDANGLTTADARSVRALAALGRALAALGIGALCGGAGAIPVPVTRRVAIAALASERGADAGGGAGEGAGVARVAETECEAW